MLKEQRTKELMKEIKMVKPAVAKKRIAEIVVHDLLDSSDEEDHVQKKPSAAEKASSDAMNVDDEEQPPQPLIDYSSAFPVS